MVSRRGFLAALAAPLIARPTLEDIKRLTWRRRFFPGWSPAAPRCAFLDDELAREVLLILRNNLTLARDVNRAFAADFAPRIGETVLVRRPQRFVIPS